MRRGVPLQGETREQRADRNAQNTFAGSQIHRQYTRLAAPYQNALVQRPTLAALLRRLYEAAGDAITKGDASAATTALAKLDAALRTPKSGEAALLMQAMPTLQDVPKAGPVTGDPLTANAETILQAAPKTGPADATPLTAAATEWRPDRPDQQALVLKLKAALEQKLTAIDKDLVPLYASSIGVDLKTLHLKVIGQLGNQPLTMANVVEAEALFKELRVKAEFIQKRDRKIGNRRRKLTEYSGALEFEPGGADALLKDKSLKAGGHFTDFAKALKAFEANGSPKETAALTKTIDSYLRHFDKFSDSDKAKAENQTKRKAVSDVQTKLAARDMIIESKAMAAKGDWSREDESKATELYLKMMLLMAEAPPRNLKGEDANEKVMAVKNVKGADKLVVKPVTGEMPVAGFVDGGGASREMLASVMGDKLQEMLGIELNVAMTKVVSIDGGKIGLEPGKAVTVSAQAFAKQAATMKDIFEAKMDEALRQRGLPITKDVGRFERLPGDVIDAFKKSVVDKVPREEVQNKAIFDLISLHCDRHLGNFMVGADNKLIPIDHGNILPTKAGILARKANLGAPLAVLATTPAAKQKLGEDQIERIERLDTVELMKTMKDAQTEMRRATPDADKGDLDEGLDNSKRSIEFLKFACRTLTLEEIYCAYSRSAGDIFFTEEKDKLAGFARAVQFATTYIKAADALEAKTIEMKVTVFNGRRQYGELLDGLHARGWFVAMGASEFEAWAEANPQKLLKILDPNYPPPQQPNPVPSVGATEAKPDNFLGKAVTKGQWDSYQKVGGDAAWTKAGGKADESLADRTKLLLEGPVRSRYLELGGDAAWIGAGGEDFTSTVDRVKVLEALHCVANVPFD